jgi:hypothetical protein
MATKKKDGSVTDAKGKALAKPDSTELATQDDNAPTGAMATVNPGTMRMGALDGDVDDVKVKLPFLEISHAMGKFTELRKGAIILAGEHQLTEGPKLPIYVTILSGRVYWKEYVTGVYDPDYIPKTYASKVEAREAGETFDWTKDPKTGEKKGPTVKVAAMYILLVRKPEDVICGQFGIELGGPDVEGEGSESTMWAPALWNVDKTSAASVTPVIKSDVRCGLQARGLSSGIYKLETFIKTFNSGNKSAVPTIKLVGFHSDAVLDQITGVCKAIGVADDAVEV